MNTPGPYELPLFPLRTVLFPGMPLPLHIFEERYKALVGECLRNHTPFGVVLIKAGAEVDAPAKPHLVGTSTRITNVERLSEGRLNIETVGQDRFRILELREHRPYLSALVENYPMSDSDSSLALKAARHLRPWVSRYMTLLAKAAETPFDPDRLPADPLALAYLAAIVLQSPVNTKQALLTLPSTVDLLDHERNLYRSEIVLLNALLTQIPEDDHSPFSAN
ncbi:MAG: LON peptidase substrate-binding domain-containing protein [Chloroflexi bacterium]|nr:LON peptidase substrate-binding domain-containing protein [Chloroflexota bacterium]